MRTELDDLRRDFGVLQHQLMQVVSRLNQMAQAIAAAGTIVAEEDISALTENLHACLLHFDSLRVRSVSMAATLHLAPADSWDVIMSMGDLDHIISVIELERYQQICDQKERSLMLLARIETLMHTDRADFAPLFECQAHATELANAIKSIDPPRVHEAVQQLIEGNHLLAQFLMLIDGRDVLDEERLDELQAALSVASDWDGRMLSIAALRGRIRARTAISAIGGPRVTITPLSTISAGIDDVCPHAPTSQDSIVNLQQCISAVDAATWQDTVTYDDSSVHNVGVSQTSAGTEIASSFSIDEDAQESLDNEDDWNSETDDDVDDFAERLPALQRKILYRVRQRAYTTAYAAAYYLAAAYLNDPDFFDRIAGFEPRTLLPLQARLTGIATETATNAAYDFLDKYWKEVNSYSGFDKMQSEQLQDALYGDVGRSIDQAAADVVRRLMKQIGDASVLTYSEEDDIIDRICSDSF